jgi:hypothetical protein
MYHDKGKTKHIDEFFFWTPNFTKIVIKQSHVLKKFLDRLDANTLKLLVDQKLMYEHRVDNLIVKNQKFYRMTNELMTPLIFPSWDANTPSVGKSSTGFIYSQRDGWFFKSGKEEVKNYLNAMDHYLINVGSQFKEFECKGLKKIKKGGILFTFSCSQAVDTELFRKIIFQSALQANRNVRILHQLSQPEDHPISIYHPESEYLKGFVLYVD